MEPGREEEEDDDEKNDDGEEEEHWKTSKQKSRELITII